MFQAWHPVPVSSLWLNFKNELNIYICMLNIEKAEAKLKVIPSQRLEIVVVVVRMEQKGGYCTLGTEEGNWSILIYNFRSKKNSKN
jgi:hypothetical protein